MISALRFLSITLFILFLTEGASAQCVPAPVINFVNPSFEGTPQAHVTPGPWSVCMSGQTPDTQPGNWGVTLAPSNGSSYLGLIHQPSTGWQEGASEQLSTPFIAGTTYTFTIDLANAQQSDPASGILPGCVECQIWGGFGPCDDNTGTGQLLWSSGDITPYDVWQTYNVAFTPSQSFTWVMIRVNSLGCSDGAYLLVDNIGPINPSNVNATIELNRNVSCAGQSNGAATVHAVGMNPPFSYAWSGGNIVADTLLNNVPAGTYSVTVTDANTCTDTASIVITEPQPITLTPLIIPVNCFGFSTGSAYLSYAGGTTPMSFAWSNGPTTQPNGNLTAGTYGFTATDANQCTASTSVTITEPTAINVTATPTDASCGNINGSVSANATGGTGALSYLWSTGSSATSLSNLGSGTYLLTVTDANSCSATASATVNALQGLSLSASGTDATCASNNGSASVNVTSGSGPYAYLWSNAATTSGISNQPPGSYDVTVTGSGGCSATASVVIGTVSGLTLSSSNIDATCGSSNGTASVNVTAGTGPYTYLWNNAATTSSVSNLPVGTYTVTVTGAGGCSATSSVAVSSSDAVVLTSTSTIANCNSNDGSASVATTSGTAPFTYLWSNGATVNAIFNVAAGTYTVTVTSQDGCSATTSVTVASSSALSIAATSTSTTCGNNNGTVSVNVNTGNPPFTFLWNTGHTTTSISSLPSGTYIVTVTDVNGCSIVGTTTVNSSTNSPVTITTDKTIMCSGDSALICAPANYSSYLWNTGQTGMCISTKLAGNYYVTVTDVNNCTASSNRVTINVYPSPPVSITVNGDTLTGYNAVTYQWYFNSNLIPGATSPVHIAQQSGDYTLAVTDSNGCRSVSTKVSVLVSGVDEVMNEQIVNIYPNPLEGSTWNLAVSEAILGSPLEVFDDNGRLVYSSEIRNVITEINLNVARGIYLLRINSDTYSITRKLIKIN